MDELDLSEDEDIFENVKPSINSIIGNQLEIRINQNIFSESNLELKENQQEKLQDEENILRQPEQTTGQAMESATFDCQFCKEKINGVAGLDKHLRNVHNAKVFYTCHVCQLKIWRVNLLKRHLRTHENKKRVKKPKESPRSKGKGNSTKKSTTKKSTTKKSTSKKSTTKKSTSKKSTTKKSDDSDKPLKENVDNYHQSLGDSFEQPSKTLPGTSATAVSQQSANTNSDWADFDDGGMPDHDDDDWGWDTDLIIPESIDHTTTGTTTTTWVSSVPSVNTNTQVKSERNVVETVVPAPIVKIDRAIEEIFCNKCTEVFHSEEFYEIHQSYHTLKVSAEIMCPKCDKRFTTVSSYLKHHKNSHKRRVRGLLKRFVTHSPSHWRLRKKKKAPCEECGQVFRNNSELKMHMQRHTGVKLFSCEECGAEFVAPSSLKRHQRRHIIALLQQDVEPEPSTSNQKSTEGAMDGDMEEVLAIGLPTPRVTGDGRKLRTLNTVRYDMDMVPRTAAAIQAAKRIETRTNDDQLTCPTCDHVSSNKSEFDLHIKTHTGVKLFKCLSCGKHCSTRSSLVRHIRLIHTDIRPHPCDHCSRTFACEADLRSHQRYLTLGKKFKCTFDNCNKSFVVRSHLLDHMRRHTGECPYHCDIEGCGRSFMTSTEINRHTRRHASQLYMQKQLAFPDSSAPFPYMCQECGRGFGMPDQFKKHQKTHDPNRKVHTCKLCGKTYFSKGSLLYHSISHEEEKNIPCPVCFKKFQTPYSLSIHQKSHLNRSRRSDAGGQVCEVCGKRLGSASGLKAHMERHTEAKKYICEQCGKACSTKGDLKFHSYSHLSVPPFKCDFCDYRCTHPTNMNHHVCQEHMGQVVGVFKEINIEGKEKSFICSTCGEGWTTEMALEHHQIYHKDEKDKDIKCKKCPEFFFTKYDLFIHSKIHRIPHPSIVTCKYCSKTFTAKVTLDTHVRYRHTGETPFPCTECERKFKSKQDLKYHSYTHSGQYPFSCSVCGKRAGSRGNLNAHMRTHQKETAHFKCPQCDESFKSRSLLKRHEYTHHKGEGEIIIASDQLVVEVQPNNDESSSLSSHHQVQENHQTTTINTRETQMQDTTPGFQLNYSQFFATW